MRRIFFYLQDIQFVKKIYPLIVVSEEMYYEFSENQHYMIAQLQDERSVLSSFIIKSDSIFLQQISIGQEYEYVTLFPLQLLGKGIS